MKLELKVPPNAIVKICSELNNAVCIYNQNNNLEFVVIPMQRGGADGKG